MKVAQPFLLPRHQRIQALRGEVLTHHAHHEASASDRLDSPEGLCHAVLDAGVPQARRATWAG
jgi:hypothetical protein